MRLIVRKLLASASFLITYVIQFPSNHSFNITFLKLLLGTFQKYVLKKKIEPSS